MDTQNQILKKLQEVSDRLDRIEKLIQPKRIIDTNTTDPILSEVIEFIKDKHVINMGDIQQRFGIGYARAARIKGELISLGYAHDATNENFIKVNSATGSSKMSPENPDPLLNQAVQIISQFDKASASLLQRRLKIGYARAARLLDELEEKGFVAPAEGSKPREVLHKSISKAKTILYIDDEKYIRELISEVLTANGYIIDLATGGEEGLNKIRNNRYDLIISDIMMPGMTGIEMLERVANENIEHGKIAILTNLTDDEIKAKIFRLGVSEFWGTADTTPEQLVAKIKQLEL